MCCLVILVGVAAGQASSSSPIRALPFYEQCQNLADTNSAAPDAIAALKDKDSQKRIQAAEALAKQCDSRATSALLTVAKDDADTNVRIAAIEALGKLGDQEAIDPLIELIEGADWPMRMALIRTLASFQVYRSNNAVLNLLTNPGDKKITEESDLRVRCFGILMVNQMRDVRFSRKAIGFLFMFQEHRLPEFRRIAEETGLELRNTRNGFHEMAAILKQHNIPDFRRKAAYWLGKFGIEEARAALEEAAANDRDPSVKTAAQTALKSIR
ncbi:MAG: HEAT repeat domain-containing protein [Acidobacteria bacterium]|nr:HEAT repeat domain-containing protein [Acidobacteriota bacterium]